MSAVASHERAGRWLLRIDALDLRGFEPGEEAVILQAFRRELAALLVQRGFPRGARARVDTLRVDDSAPNGAEAGRAAARALYAELWAREVGVGSRAPEPGSSAGGES